MSDTPAAAAVPAEPSVEAAPSATPAPEPKHKLKVNGKEVELGLSEIIRRAQIAEAGQGAMQEAATLKKAQAALEDELKANPRGALAKMAEKSGKSLRDIAIEMLSEEMNREIEESKLSPDAKRARELEDRLKKLEGEKEDRKQADYQAKVDAAHQHLTGNIIATMRKMPEAFQRHELVANRVVDAWSYIVEHSAELADKGLDLKTVTPERVAQIVMKDLRSVAKNLGGTLKDEELDEVFDEPLRARALKRWAKASGVPHPGLTSTPQVREPKNAPAAQKPSRAALLRGMSRPFGG